MSDDASLSSGMVFVQRGRGSVIGDSESSASCRGLWARGGVGQSAGDAGRPSRV